MAEKLFLIDGHSHLYRAFYAVRGLTTPEGRPSNAVYGFTLMLRKILRDYNPDYIAVCFDLPGPTFRHKLYKEYKAQREKPPDEFISQIPMTREVIEALEIPVYAVPGFEADDVIGTIARQAAEAGIETVVVTGDKDARQLLGPMVSMYDGAKDKFLVEADLRAEGITPEQVIEIMSLSGDSSDNVPGIPKVGPKTALDLIKRFGTLENTLAHADEVKAPALREKLKTFADQARLSRTLVTIDTHVPVELDLKACRVRPPDPAKVGPVYRKFGFRQFMEDVPASPTQEKSAYALVDAPELLANFAAELNKQTRFAFGVQFTGQSAMAGRLVGISFSWQARTAFYLPFRGPLGARTLPQEATLNALRPILSNPRARKIGHDLKQCALVLRNAGVDLQGIEFDTMVAAYVLNAESRRYGLDELAADFLQHTKKPLVDLIGKGRNQITIDAVPTDMFSDYACAEADLAFRLHEVIGARLRDSGLEKLFREIEMPLVSVLADMEFHGVGLDVKELEQMSGWLAEQLERLQSEIYREAGEEFNVSSPQQLAKILFEKLGLPKKGKKASTDVDVLTELSVAHRLPGLVLEFRQLNKLKNTYVDALPEMVLPATGCIHTSFNQTATATGRLSSSDPNLQNIPVRTELGERIRKAFVPRDRKNLLLTADYSQIELRILAHISGDKALREAFARDVDIHQFVAAQIHNLEPDAVTPAMRRAAKAVNFGIVYGLSAFGLSRDIGIPVDEAGRFINDYFERYPGVKRFIDDTIADARKNQSVSTLLGRRRPLKTIDDPDRATRSFAERAAVNTVIQGTAADMIKVAMIRIQARLAKERMKTKMILQIHDELIFEMPPAEQLLAADLVVSEMASALKMDVPVKVNVAVGKNWKESK